MLYHCDSAIPTHLKGWQSKYGLPGSLGVNLEEKYAQRQTLPVKFYLLNASLFLLCVFLYVAGGVL